MSIKVGDKYIIEIGAITELPDGKKKYFIKPFESLVFDKTGLAQLEPVEKAWESELAKAKELAYNKALKDVNHAIDVLTGMTGEGCAEWFEDCVGVDEVVCGFTVQRIVEITKAYEETKKAEEESIKVGDEVACNCPNEQRVIITAKYDNWVTFMRKDGACYSSAETGIIKKTGRHFDEIEQLLDKLRGDEE